MYGHPSLTALSCLADDCVAVAACAVGITADGEIQLLPYGRFRARDGRPRDADAWRLDDSTAPALLQALSAHQDRIVIDYEHQTLKSSANGKPAPAAGWFRGSDVVYRSGEGLFVRPEWTEAARAHIDAGEYAYFSPVIRYRPGTGVVLDIVMGALTNFAAIDGMQQIQLQAERRFALPEPSPVATPSAAALAFSQPTAAWRSDHEPEPTVQPRTATEEKPMLKKLIRMLGLAEDATEEAVLDAIEALKAEQENAEQAIAAARAEMPDETIEAMTALQNELAELKAGLQHQAVDDLVSAALSDGRLTPAMEDWARQLGEQNIESLSAFLEQAAPIAALNGNQSGGKEPPGTRTDALDDAALAVCKQLGIDPEDYLKTLQEDE